jgi:acyl-CoA synthetase (AMP-forming)/AMP-acid ligase II
MTGAASARAALRAVGVLPSRDGAQRLELRTSGSTRAPRTVTRSVASWLDSFEPFATLTALSRHDSVLVPAPTGSSMFAFAEAHAAWLGASTVPLPRWNAKAAAAATRTCTAAHLTPTMLAALLEHLPEDSRLATVVCAGAPLPDPVRQRATEAGLRVVDYYGAAELSFVAIRHPDGVMRAFPGVEISLRDGVIWARSPYVCDGYAAGQSGPFRRAADGWRTVGDRGSWHSTLGLVVQGRGDELVLTGGASVLPGDVEQALLRAPGVETAVVVGLPHTSLGEVVAAVLVARPGAALQGASLRRHAAHELSPSHRPRRWFAVDHLPLTEAGKVARYAVRQALLEGTLGARIVV